MDLYPNLLVDWPTPGSSASSTMTVLECLSSNQRFKPRPCDPRKLRNDFLGLKEDTESLLAFLNHYGAWQVGFYDGAWDVIRTLMRHEDIRTTLGYGGKSKAETGRAANARVVEMLRKRA
jgi:hypothetical protein